MPKMRQMMPLLVAAGRRRRVAGRSSALAAVRAGLAVGGGLPRLWRLDGARPAQSRTARWPAFSAMVMHLAWSAGFWLQLVALRQRRRSAHDATHDARQDPCIDICVCTFRRPRACRHAALARRAMTCRPDATIRIIVADNDDRAERRARWSTSWPRSLPFQIVYRALPGRQHLDRPQRLPRRTARRFRSPSSTMTRRLSTDWLAELVDDGRRRPAPTRCSGRCGRVYADGGARLDAARRFPFDRCRSGCSGEIRTGYTCNVLLRRGSPSPEGRRFNLALARPAARTPNSSPHGRGRRPHRLCAGGLVDEPVPRRPRAVRLAGEAPVPQSARRMARLLGRNARGGEPASGKSGLPRPRSAIASRRQRRRSLVPVRRNRYALRGVMHAGVVSGLLGVREIRLYGASAGGRSASMQPDVSFVIAALQCGGDDRAARSKARSPSARCRSRSSSSTTGRATARVEVARSFPDDRVRVVELAATAARRRPAMPASRWRAAAGSRCSIPTTPSIPERIARMIARAEEAERRDRRRQPRGRREDGGSRRETMFPPRTARGARRDRRWPTSSPAI